MSSSPFPVEPTRAGLRSAGTPRRRRWRGRWIVLAVGVLIVVAGLSAAWIGWRGLAAKRHLEAARDGLPAVQAAWSAGDLTAGTQRLTAVQSAADAALADTHDPVWWVAAHLPIVGQPVATTRGLTEAVDALARTSLPKLSAAADIARPDRLVTGPATVDIARLAEVAGSLAEAASSLDAERVAVQSLSPSWVPQIAQARQQLLDKLAPVATTAHSAATAAQILPPMLGASGPRRYFVGFQNPAETRGTGGLLDAFAIVTATHGTIAIAKVGTNAQLPALPATVDGLDPAYVQRYSGQGALGLWVNSNLSPDFPEVATAWAAMWQAATQQKVDGAIALDPAALAGILAATGPVNVAGIGAVDAANVLPLVLKDQYRLTADVATRKGVMLGVGTATIDALLSGRGDRGRLLDAMKQAATGRHVLVHSAASAEQLALADAGVDGAVAHGPVSFVQAVVLNTAGSKLDAYLAASTAYLVTACTPAQRTSTVTVTLTNTAPKSGLPEYVTRRADYPKPAVPLGQNRVNLQVLLTDGATVTRSTLDGRPVPLEPAAGQLPKTLDVGSGVFLTTSQQAGHPSYGVELELPIGTPRTLVLTVSEPPGSGAPVMPVQPLAIPMKVSADTTKCGPNG